MIPEPTTVATSSHVPKNSAVARRGRSKSDIRLSEVVVVRFRPAAFASEAIERMDRQAGEDADAVVQHVIGIGKGQVPLGIGTLDFSVSK
jgi:hypothetical protein